MTIRRTRLMYQYIMSQAHGVDAAGIRTVVTQYVNSIQGPDIWTMESFYTYTMEE